MTRVKRWRRRLTDPAVYLTVSAAVHAAGMLSPAARRQLAALAGSLWWWSGSQRRRTVRENLAIAFPQMPEMERIALGRRSVCHALRNALDFAHLLHAPQAVLSDVSLDAVTARLRDGGFDRPVMMVIPHLGSWELFGHAATLSGIPTAAVAHELRNPYLERLVRRARTAHGLQIIHSTGAARGVVRAVRAGYNIGLLMDQNTRVRDGGAYVAFFGLPVTVTRAPAVLARRLGLALHVGACVRHAGGFQIVTESLPQAPGAYADDLSLLQAVMAANEALIRRFPDQYLWTYRRWRYIPAALPVAEQRRYPFYARPESNSPPATST
jgi:Kdo2-lipid IVA lauroyltransferase/acyltransferase